jgi:hypothetical protein
MFSYRSSPHPSLRKKYMISRLVIDVALSWSKMYLFSCHLHEHLSQHYEGSIFCRDFIFL